MQTVAWLDKVIGQELTEQMIPVIRELITNAIKHADASAIDLVVLANQTYCEIRVVDNGKGYVAGARKSGLLNLERRALARGGEFEILKNVNSGTRTPCLHLYGQGILTSPTFCFRTEPIPTIVTMTDLPLL